MLSSQFPEVATMLADAALDLLAFTGLFEPHWHKLWSTNTLEWLRGEIKRRTNVVGIFANDAAVARLVAQRHYLSEESMANIGVTQAPAIRAKARKALCATG